MPYRYIDFVITGTPRSGTTYMAALLCELGYDCGHERSFDPWHLTFAEERVDETIWGDSSWLAAPYLIDLPAPTRVIHVVRNPVDAINSIMSTGQLDWPHDYRTFIAHHWQRDRDWWPADVAGAAEAFWRWWNRRIEASGRVDFCVRLESVLDDLELLVAAIDPERVLERGLADEIAVRLPEDVNTRRHEPFYPVVTLEMLEDETLEQARRYGYDA